MNLRFGAGVASDLDMTQSGDIAPQKEPRVGMEQIMESYIQNLLCLQQMRGIFEWGTMGGLWDADGICSD